MISLLLLLACSANALEVKAPSPNSGTITPSAITTGVGSFSGSVTAGSMTALSGFKTGTSAGTTSNEVVLMNGSGASAANVISLFRSGASEAVIAQTGGNDLVLGFDPASRTTANLNAAAKVMIKSGGSVGIGTASPATTLDVNGNAQFGSGATKSTFTATGFWEPISKTKAQIDALVPTKVGQVIYASDTTLPGLCISTGTAVAQWRKMESATLGCGTNN